MKLRIGDTEYDYRTALNKAQLGHLMDLKTQGGPGRRGVQVALDLIDKGLQKGDDPTGVEDNPEVLTGMAGLIFLCKRHAGEPITWTECLTYAWPDLAFLIEDGDIPDPDPQVASGGANQPDAETPKERTSKGKTSAGSTRKTSKPRSTSTS